MTALMDALVERAALAIDAELDQYIVRPNRDVTRKETSSVGRHAAEAALNAARVPEMLDLIEDFRASATEYTPKDLLARADALMAGIKGPM